ncbi:MAG: TonB-dependent receptor [Rhodospirillaceae bacterium]|nr:TonB-dependent receptor [Rhodospirillaceae bacterium]MDE0617416.1 TonB-dependent receptor [Rhodospirillaceae bacterium]
MRRVSKLEDRARISQRRQISRRPAARWCLAAVLVAAAPAAAASAEPKAADERTSVASHIPGSVGGVRPVHVITRQEIERSGASTIADLVSNLNDYNNFGIYRSLLGGAAFMVDGRPTSGLSALPLQAVERIEILSDSAGALYPDNPGGAINIVLRHGFEGATAWAATERPARPGSEIENVGAMWGGKIGRGRLTIGVDGFRQAEIRNKDRPYTAASWTDGGSFAGVSGVSVGGNTIFVTDGNGTNTTADDVTVARPLGECSGSSYTGFLSNPNSITGTGCGFAWADIAWIDDHPRLERYSLFANFDHPLRKGATFYAAARFSQGKTKFRYAPLTGPFTFDFSNNPNQALLDFRTRLLSSDLDLPGDFIVNEVTKVTLNHRFTAHGNREWHTDLLEYDLATGVRGRLGAGIGYDMHVRSHRVSSLQRSGTFVSERLIRQAIIDGSYNLEDPLNPPSDPVAAAAHREAVRNSAVRQKYSTDTSLRGARLVLDGPGGPLPGGPLRWAAGLEVDHREERTNQIFRSNSGTHDVSDVIGQGGASYSGERLRWSAFGELRLPLHQDWTVALAVRHDRHDDVGPTWSYQAATVWRLHKVLSLRGSWETGRSPATLQSLHSPPSGGFPRVCDTKTHTGPLADCPRPQIEATYVSNPELEPHKTQVYTIGAKATLGRLSVSADWFRIENSETPGRLSSQKIVDIDATGGSLPSGAAVIREGNLLRRVVNPLVNSGESETSGVNVRAGARWKFGELDTGFDLRWLHVLDDEARVDGIEQPGDFPRNRIHATLSAGPGLRGRGWIVDWHTRAISEYSNIDNSGRFKTWIAHDVGLDWRNVFGVKDLTLRGGVFNLGDAGPPTDTSNPQNREDRYDAVRGRTFYLSLKAKW